MNESSELDRDTLMRNISSSVIVGLSLLFFAGSVYSQTVSASIEWGTSPATVPTVYEFLRTFATENERHGPFRGMAAFDVSYPASVEELNQLGGNAVLAITAITPVQERLPPARVFVTFGKEEVDLKKFHAIYSQYEGEPDKVPSVLGRFRMDAVYLLPMSVRFKPGLSLWIRFANDPSGPLLFGSFDGPVPGELKVIVSKAPTDSSYSDTYLKAFIARKFPEYGRRMMLGSSTRIDD